MHTKTEKLPCVVHSAHCFSFLLFTVFVLSRGSDGILSLRRCANYCVNMSYDSQRLVQPAMHLRIITKERKLVPEGVNDLIWQTVVPRLQYRRDRRIEVVDCAAISLAKSVHRSVTLQAGRLCCEPRLWLRTFTVASIRQHMNIRITKANTAHFPTFGRQLFLG